MRDNANITNRHFDFEMTCDVIDVNKLWFRWIIFPDIGIQRFFEFCIPVQKFLRPERVAKKTALRPVSRVIEIPLSRAGYSSLQFMTL